MWRIVVSLKSPGVELPIRTIHNNNLQAHRTGTRVLEDLQPLVDSIRTLGMQLPVLILAESLQVVDGNRRLAAAETLGWETVPVLCTSDWEVASRYMREKKALEATLPFLSLSWEELDTLASYNLLALYSSHLNALKGHARHHGPVAPANGPSLYNNAIGELLGIEPSIIKTVRDTFASVRRCEKLGQFEKAKRLKELIVRVETEAPADEPYRGIYGLRNTARDAASGAITLEDMERRLVRGAKRRRRSDILDANPDLRRWERARRDGAGSDFAQTVFNLTQVLSQLSSEAERLGKVVESLSEADVVLFANSIRISVNRFNALRRKLYTAGTKSNENPTHDNENPTRK
jgi:ParB/Sulfiredoxin domain